MGEEGMHGWVNRKISSVRYGVDFYVPDKIDYAAKDIAFYLQITSVDKDKPAAEAGIKNTDRIVGVNELWIDPSGQKNTAADLIRTMADAPEDQPIKVQVRRLDQTAENTYLEQITFEAGKKPFFYSPAKKILTFLPSEKGSQQKTKTVVIIMIIMLLMTIVRCVAKYFQTYTAQEVMQVGINGMRTDIFGHMMTLPVGFFESERPSDTVSRIINDTNIMGKAIKIIMGKALREPLNAIGMLSVAFFIDWQLTLIFLGGGPFVIGAVGIFGKKMKKASRKSLAAWSQMLSKLQEVVAGLKIVKVYGRQDYEKNRFNAINLKYLKQLLKISKVDALTSPILEILGMIAGSAAIITGAYWVNNSKMDGSEFLTLLLALGFAAESVRKTSDIWNKIQEANAASERIYEIMDKTPEIEAAPPQILNPLAEKIEFSGVQFTYPRSEFPVLKQIDLTVKAGQNVAVVGPNGSGKSTLMNLLPRFYDVDQGHIKIDGLNINEVTLQSLRQQIGIVTQNMVTFNDTVAANIAYGKIDADMDQIINAAQKAYAHEFVEPLADGYETIIGENGVGLSGGQLQRIVIARAILKDPTILIFDEATSQVDADSEAKIHKAIQDMMKNRTCFIIAHRFSTILNADMIVVMDRGQIVAKGQHDDLIKSCRLYQSLYETQLVGS
jgi:ABC-type multidrug transport system fused ATPase/permease subunit